MSPCLKGVSGGHMEGNWRGITVGTGLLQDNVSYSLEVLRATWYSSECSVDMNQHFSFSFSVLIHPNSDKHCFRQACVFVSVRYPRWWVCNPVGWLSLWCPQVSSGEGAQEGLVPYEWAHGQGSLCPELALFPLVLFLWRAPLAWVWHCHLLSSKHLSRKRTHGIFDKIQPVPACFVRLLQFFCTCKWLLGVDIAALCDTVAQSVTAFFFPFRIWSNWQHFNRFSYIVKTSMRWFFSL